MLGKEEYDKSYYTLRPQGRIRIFIRHFYQRKVAYICGIQKFCCVAIPYPPQGCQAQQMHLPACLLQHRKGLDGWLPG